MSTAGTIDKRLRLGVDATMLTPVRSGIGNYVFNLLWEMAALPEAPAIFLYSRGAIADDCRGLGTCVEFVVPGLRKGPLWLSSGLLPLLHRDRIDVFWGALSYVPMRRLHGMRTVVTTYDIVEWVAGQTMTPRNRWIRRVFQPLSIWMASSVVAISHATGSQVGRYFRRDVDAVVHPRMDPAFVRPVEPGALVRVKARYELPDHFLLALGTLEPRKNLRALLAAYADVCGRQALPMLVLAGSRGWLDASIQSMVQALQETGRVRWLGFVPQEDLPPLYALSDLFVFVPTYEGFGMPVREALLSGARVLASDIDAVKEAGGRWPRYIDPSQASIAAALERYASAPSAFIAKSEFRLSDVDVGSAASFLRVLADERPTLDTVQ